MRDSKSCIQDILHSGQVHMVTSFVIEIVELHDDISELAKVRSRHLRKHTPLIPFNVYFHQQTTVRSIHLPI